MNSEKSEEHNSYRILNRRRRMIGIRSCRTGCIRIAVVVVVGDIGVVVLNTLKSVHALTE